jgi:hypothetical protein
VAEFSWFEAHPPRTLDLADVTGLVRVLATRPRLGLQQIQPVVTFELWLGKDQVKWLVGCDQQIARHFPGELAAQVGGLSFTAARSTPRCRPVTAREVRITSSAYPLRLDTANSVVAGLLQVRHRLSADEQIVVQWVIGPSHTYARRLAPFAPLESLGLVSPRQPDAGERTAWNAKIAEPSFGVRGRVGAVAENPKRAAQLIGPAVSALSLVNGPHARVQTLRQSSRTADLLYRVVGRTRTWSSMLNAAELATMIGWPIDGVSIPGERDLGPAPRPLLVPADTPEKADGDRLVGISTHPRDEAAFVRLPVRSATSHIHLVAPTGSGKSTLLAGWLQADMEAGRSVFLLEPKGDLVTDVLSLVPAHRRDDVVVVSPGNDEQPAIGLNPLQGPREDAERRADSLLHLFKAVFGSSIGPRSSDVLLHSLILAARLDDGSLIDIPTLLTNAAFRRRVLAKVGDPLIIAPWASGFDSLSEQEQARVVMPVLNKTRAFTNRTAIRRMLGQAAPRFTLDELFTSPKIVLVSLNAGVVGHEQGKLLGSIILGQFWEAIQRQASVPSAERRPVMAVVDELADYVSALDFAEILAKARGMNVSFTAAHQHLKQLSPSLRAALLSNARNRVSWQPAKDDAKTLGDVLGVPADLLMKLPAYHAVAQVLVKNTPSAPFMVKTLPLPESTSDPDELRRTGAARYGVDPKVLDAVLLERWQGGDQSTQGPVGVVKRGQQR